MRRLKVCISVLIITSLIVGSLPLNVAFAEASEPNGENLTNSSTVVDLEALKTIIDDDTDSNEDGLPDELKRMLGLDPELEDSNADGISDKFKLDNGLDPLKHDTYDIGISDLYALTKGDEEIDLISDLLNEDHDGDGIVDIKDSDIDNDLVSNGIDLSPFSQLEVEEKHTIKVKTSGKTAGLKLQLQPGNMDSLVKNSRVMTWPIDINGQMTNFNATEDNVRIVPMLEVNMDEYPSDSILDEWGYLLFEEQLYIPLQYIEEDYKPVALEANIHLPAEFGMKTDGKYEVEMDVRLSWLMVGQTHTVTKQWEPFAKVQSLYKWSAPTMNGSIPNEIVWEDREEWRDIELEDFDYQNDKEYLSSDIADLNSNGIPDLAVYWVENNNVYEKKYYDLTLEEDTHTYHIDSEDEPEYVYQSFEYANKKQARIDSESGSDYTRVHNAKYVVNLDNNRRNTAYYYVNDTNSTLEVIANEKNSAAGPEKSFIIDNHSFFAEEPSVLTDNSIFSYWSEPRKYSYIRDAAYKSIPDSSFNFLGTVFYLYEIYNQETDNNEILLMLDHSESDENKNIIQTETLIDDLPADITSQYNRSQFRDLEKALSLDIYDVDQDEQDDLVFTDRSGRMFVILDIYDGGNWKDRMYQIPDNRKTENIHGQHTGFYDFDDDGNNEMVGVQAVRTDETTGSYGRTHLNFQISTKKEIEKSSEILMKDYESFAITGMQLEEHKGVDTKLITGEDTEELLYMSALFYNWYLQSDYSIEDVVDEYVLEVMEGDRSSLEEISGNYGYLLEALLDIGEEVNENESWKSFDGPKPLLILTWEEDSFLNLGDLEDNDFSGETISIDISENEIVTSKQLIVKWIENGETLSPNDIEKLVEDNPESLYEFDEDPLGNKEAMAQLNIGVTEIIGIGDETLESEPFNAYRDALDEWKSIWVVGKGTKYGIPVLAKMVGIKVLPKMGLTSFLPPNALLQPNNAVYKLKLAKYKAFSGNMTALGKVVKGTGTLIDIGLAVYSGYLYGEAMAEVGGTAFGVVTGITYGSMVLASSILVAKLAAIGPVGWVVLGALLADTLVSVFVEEYDGIMAISFKIIMNLLFEAKIYPGTMIESIAKTDNEDKNGITYNGTKFGYRMGSEVEELSQYHIDIVAASYDTPANSSDGLADSWADLNIYNQSSTVDTNNNRSKSSDELIKRDGYWHRYINWDFNNTLQFNKPGINLPVDNRTSLYYRLIESTKQQRYVVYTNTEVEYSKDTLRSKSTDYYDVMPESLEMFWEYFNFINWDENPNHAFPNANNNEIAYRSPYYDSNKDGVPDRIKEELELDISSNDSDGDGITDYKELKLGLDPLKTDSDGEGVSDYDELNVPVEFTITTSNGSISAWGYSDPMKVDSSSDDFDDDQKRRDGLNPASKHTQGSKLFDYNNYAPELIQEFVDLEVVDLDWLEFNLSDYITDQDSDDELSSLVFNVSHGEVEENEAGDFIWKYQFDMAQNGRYLELSLEANDLKGGILETSFIVYDESGPTILKVRADYDDGSSIHPRNLESFLQPLPSNPDFFTEFNKPIDFDNITGSAIKIEPIGERGYLDTDNNLNPLETNVELRLLDEETFKEISIIRPQEIVEDGIEYQLLIPGNSITDRDPENPYPMDKDYKINFFTEDNEPPKIKEIRYGLDGLGQAWDFNNPLVIEFNEEIILADERYYPVSSDAYRRGFTLADIADGGYQYISPGEGHLLMNQIDSRTFIVEIESNYLKSSTEYSMYHPDNATERYDVRDLAGNRLNLNYLPENNIPTIETGDVRGPYIIENQNRRLRVDENRYNNYEVDIQPNGEIQINFNEPIFAGAEYDNIVLTYGNSIHLWMHEVIQNEVKTAGLSHTKVINGNQLIITPVVPFADQADYMNYAVYIPSKALTDITGNTMFSESRYNDSNTRYGAGYNDFTEVVRARTPYNHELDLYPVVIDHVSVPQEWGHRSILEAMISYPEESKNIIPWGKTLMVALSDRANSVSLEHITLWQLDNEENELEEIPHTPFFTVGSNVVLITPQIPLDIGSNYKIKFAESESEIDVIAPDNYTYNGISITKGTPFKYNITNPASESHFTISDSRSSEAFSGGIDISMDSFVGMTRVDEVVSIKGNISKYYDQFNDRFNRKGDLFKYQWYIGDTNNSDNAQPILGENNIFLIPRVEHEGKYLFLELQVDYEGLDDYIPEELRFGSTVFKILSPALGPIKPAFITNNELQNIKVFANGEESRELLKDFDNSIELYNISVSPETKMVSIKPEFDEAINSFVSINGLPSDWWKLIQEDGESVEAGLEIPLDFGKNNIYVSSIAENYVEQKIFTIKITRESQSENDFKELPPEARLVKIKNDKDFFTGMTLEGQYEYFDELAREEHGSTYQWYRHSENNAESRTPIAGGTDLNYLITDEDVGHYISFEVIPRAEDGNVAGEKELSWWIGPVSKITEYETAITNIEVLYNGSNLLSDYSSDKKVYPIDFASEENNTVNVRIEGGNNVSINGESTNETALNFQEEQVLEILADSVDSNEPTSYFIVLDYESVPSSIVLEGRETLSMGDNDETIRWQAIIYDQYGDLIEEKVEWDISSIPSNYNYRISGLKNDYLTIKIPVTSDSEIIDMKAWIKNDVDVLEEKRLQVTADPYINLSELSENLTANFEPSFLSDIYQYTIEANATEKEIELKAILDEPIDSTIQYSYEESNGRITKEVSSGIAEIIQLTHGENTINIDVEKVNHRKTSYNIIVNNETSVEYEALGDISLIEPSSVSYSEKMFLVPYDVTDFNFNDDGTDKKALYDAEQDTWNITVKRPQVTTGPYIYLSELSENLTANFEPSFLSDIYQYTIEANATEKEIELKAILDEPIDSTIQYSYEESNGRITKEVSSGIAEIIQLTHGENTINIDVEKVNHRGTSYSIIVNNETSVEYEALGDISLIEPSSVSYSEKMFLVPYDVTDFNFNDDGTDKKALYDAEQDTWNITVKRPQVTTGPYIYLSELSENLTANFEPSFLSDIYQYTIEANATEKEIELKAILDEPIDSTIQYSYEESNGRITKEVSSGIAEIIQLTHGENTINIDVEKVNHRGTSYNIIVNNETSVEYEALGDISLIEPSSVSYSEKMFLVPYDVTDFNFNDDGTDKKALYDAEQDTWNITVKRPQVTTGPYIYLSELSENLTANFEPSFLSDIYQYTIEANATEKEIELKAILDEPIDSTIQYSYEESNGRITKEVSSGIAEIIQLTHGENTINIDVEKVNHRKTSYNIIVNNETSVEYEALGDISLIEPSSVSYSEKMFLVPYDVTDFNFNDDGTDKKALYDAEQDTWNITVKRPQVTTGPYIYLSELSENLTANFEPSFLSDIYQYTIEANATEKEIELKAILDEPIDSTIQYSYEESNGRITKEVSSGIAEIIQLTHGENTINIDVEKVNHRKTSYNIIVNNETSVEYEALGEISLIEPSSVSYSEKMFLVPYDVTDFNFNDDGIDKKALYDAEQDTWNITVDAKMTVIPGELIRSENFNEVFTLSIENDRVTEFITASDIILGEAFDGLSIGQVEREDDVTITVELYGDLDNTGIGSITLDEGVLTYSNNSLHYDVIIDNPSDSRNQDNRSKGGLTSNVTEESAVEVSITTSDGEKNTTTVIKLTVGTDNSIDFPSVKMPSSMVKELISKLKVAEAQENKIVLQIDLELEAEGLETIIPVDLYRGLLNISNTSLEIVTNAATIKFDSNAINGIAQSTTTGDIAVSFAKVTNENLSQELQLKVADQAVYEFVAKNTDGRIIEFNGNVTVSIPYILKHNENSEAIVIYYINSNDELELLTNSIFNTETGRITFNTRHFSLYMLGYNEKIFNDVSMEAWYSKAVRFIASREITKGTSTDQFSPKSNVTRAQLIVMAMRAYEIIPKEAQTDNFIDAGNHYYTPYLSTAKHLGISKGIGNNMFAPDKEVTREEMFTLLFNILKVSDELPRGGSGKKLSDYSDSEEISSWAETSTKILVGADIINGSEGKLNPNSKTSRAEMAQVLYNLLSR